MDPTAPTPAIAASPNTFPPTARLFSRSAPVDSFRAFSSAFQRQSGLPEPELDLLGMALTQAILDQLHFGVMVLGANLELLFANQAARRECARHPLLSLEQGRLAALQSRHDSHFAHAVAAARAGRRSLVQLDDGSEQTLLALSPLPGAPPRGECPILVLFGLRSERSRLALQFYAQACELTTAETRMLLGLSEGHSPSEIARRNGVALSTVRSHICSLRGKTGTKTITDLVRTISRLPPVMPAVLSAE